MCVCVHAPRLTQQIQLTNEMCLKSKEINVHQLKIVDEL